MQAFIDFPESEHTPGRCRARFADPVEVLTACRPGEVQALLRQAQAHAEAGRWCLGALAYEAAGAFDATLPTHAPLPGWPLARFAVFERALPWPETDGRHVGGRCTPWRFSMPRELYGRRVERT